MVCLQPKHCSAELERRCTLRSAEVHPAEELLTWYGLKSRLPPTARAARGGMGELSLGPCSDCWTPNLA